MIKELARETKIALLCIIVAKFFGCMSMVALGAATFGYHEARTVAFICGGLWLFFLIVCVGFCIKAYLHQKPDYEKALYERLKAKYEAPKS